MVTFLTFPNTTRVPGAYVEVDPNRQHQSARIQPYRILVIGQLLTTGSADALTLQEIRTASSARALFGRGSQLAQQLERCLALSNSVPVFAVGLDDPTGGAATGTITITGTATEPGELDLYIGGRRVPVPIALGDDPTDIGTAISAAITANADLAVSATNLLGVVTLTAKHDGTIGNLIDTRHSYQFGERVPAGVTAVIVQLSGGTGDVDLSDVWPVIGDEQYHLIAIGVHDATNLTEIEQELLSRFGVLRAIDGHAITARNADVATLATLGGTRNSKHLSILSVGESPTAPWEIAAQAAAQVAVSGQADPALPFQTLSLPDVLPPERADRFTFANKDELLHTGIATCSVDDLGAVRLERVITTYRLDENAVEDSAYLDLTTLLTLSFLRWDFRATLRQKYSRSKIGEDGVRYASGQSIMTPNGGRAEALASFRSWQERGLVEDIDQFQKDLVVERNTVDPTRMDFFLPANLANGLIVIGVRLSFIL